MRVSLIDVDSTIPNLALMKLSAYHKKKGDDVGLDIADPDLVYISCVFSKNKEKALGVSRMFTCPVRVGGYGVNDNRLSDEVEHVMPDYSLYGCGYSMGFTSRGCIRRCPFCVVPEKEGGVRVTAVLSEFLDPCHDHVMLLDNNILALPDHFRGVAGQLIDRGVSVDFNQGLDIRLVDDGNAGLISQLRIRPSIRFAWDDRKDERLVREGISVLRDHGVGQCLFYVLVGFNSSREDDLYRLNVLRDLGQRAYVMRYPSCRGVRWYNDVASWANQPRFFGSMSFDDFIVFRHDRSKKMVRV